MTLREDAMEQAMLAREMKEMIGEDVMTPRVVVVTKDGHTDLYMVYGDTDRYHEFAAYLVTRKIGTANLAQMFIHIDAWVSKEALSGESAELAFRDGAPVREAIHTFASDPDDVVIVEQVYRYTPVDGWEWEEPIVREHRNEGWGTVINACDDHVPVEEDGKHYCSRCLIRLYTTDEVREEYEVLGFQAPFCVVRRKSDGVLGSLRFMHHPRFYYDFQEG